MVVKGAMARGVSRDNADDDDAARVARMMGRGIGMVVVVVQVEERA